MERWRKRGRRGVGGERGSGAACFFRRYADNFVCSQARPIQYPATGRSTSGASRLPVKQCVHGITHRQHGAHGQNIPRGIETGARRQAKQRPTHEHPRVDKRASRGTVVLSAVRVPSQRRTSRAGGLSDVLAAQSSDRPQAVAVLRPEHVRRHAALVRQKPRRRCYQKAHARACVGKKEHRI